MKRQQRRLDRLLGGSPNLSVHEKEQMLQRLASPGRERRLWSSRWLWASAVTAALAAVVVPVVLHDADELESRGGRMVHGSFHVVCDGHVGVCRRGEAMAFDLMPPDDAPFFGAAALRDDGLLVWYFPDETGEALRVETAGVAARGVIVGAEQPAGSYRVIGAFASAPFGRDELKQAIEGAATSLHLVSEPLEVK